MLTHLDLFSGIGGFALAAEWAGFQTIGFVEIDKYCQKVLRKHWSDVPIVEDIRDVKAVKEVVANATGGRFEQCQVWREAKNDFSQVDKNTRAATGGVIEPITLITGGFPCQPFSVAGKQLSQGDNRYLWPQTLTVIKAIKPRWVLLENVAGIINLALDTVLSDLEGEGYSYETLVIPACAVNAPHRRDRVWIVAHNEHLRLTRRADTGQRGNDGESPRPEVEQRSPDVAITQSRQPWKQTKPEGREDTGGGSQEDVADSQREGLEGSDTEGNSCPTGQSLQSDINSKGDGIQGRQPIGYEASSRDWWAVEPELGRVAHGIPNRVDRLKCLGNAIVPQVAYHILKVIAEIETG